MWDKKRITFAVEKNIHEWEKAFARRKKHIKNQSDITLPEWVKIIHTTKYSRSQHLAYFHLSRVHFVATPSHILNVRLCTLICFAIAISNSSFIITKCRTNVWHCSTPPKRAEQKRNKHRLVLLKYGTQFGIQKLAHENKWREKLIGLRGWENSSHFHKNFNEPIVKRWITVENIRWQKWMNKKEKKEARPSNTNSKDMNPERTRKKTHSQWRSAKFKIWFISI